MFYPVSVPQAQEEDDPRFVLGGYAKPTVGDIWSDFKARILKPFGPQLAPVTYELFFTDVSIYNGVCDFVKMRQYAQLVAIRMGYGSNGIDGRGVENYYKAIDSGMVPFFYWFMKPNNTSNWKDHINSFGEVVTKYPTQVPPVFDAEYTSFTTNVKQQTGDWFFKMWKNWVDASLPDPIIYTRASWWDTHTYRLDYPKLLELWTAHWNTSITEPAIPADWGAIKNPRTWWGWQYMQKSPGKDFGVESSKLDYNRHHWTIAQFNSTYGTNVKPLGDEEPPVVPPDTEDLIHPIKTVRVTPTAGLNFRASPDAGSTKIGASVVNSELPITEISDDGQFGKVEGYVALDYTQEV